MDFKLSEEQELLRDTARRFARDEMAPVAGHYDQSGEFPRAIIRKAWELGLVSMCIPEENGGLGLPILEQCLVVEELSWGCAGMTTSMMANDLGLTPILVGGNEDQKKRWLTNFTGDLRARLELTARLRGAASVRSAGPAIMFDNFFSGGPWRTADLSVRCGG